MTRNILVMISLAQCAGLLLLNMYIYPVGRPKFSKRDLSFSIGLRKESCLGQFGCSWLTLEQAEETDLCGNFDTHMPPPPISPKKALYCL